MRAPAAARLSGYRRAFQALRLGLSLFFDRRVPLWLKLIPVFSILYILSPFDLIPDFTLPVIGYVDDTAIFFLSLYLFIRLAPKLLVEEHLRTL